VLKTIVVTIVFLCLLINHTKLYGQIHLNTVVKQPTCIRALGHNYEQIGDGIINILPSGGIPPYTFWLYEGFMPLSTFVRVQNNGYFPGLIGGNWHIEIFDAIGQSIFFDMVLTPVYNTPSGVIESYNNPAGCASSDGNVTLNGIYGTPPYLYSIDGGSNFTVNNSFGNLTGGFYSLLIKDANGCLGAANNIFIPALNLICDSCNTVIASSQITATTCGDDGVFKTWVRHKNFPYDDSVWKFSTDGINFHPPNFMYNSDTAGNLPAGLHHVYIKDTVTGIVTKSAYTIGKSCHVYISSIAVDASCRQSDGMLTVNASNGAVPYTYTIDGINFQNSNIFPGLASGVYSIGVKDANGGINSAVAVVYNKCPIIVCKPSPENCSNRDGTIQSHGYRGTRPYLFSIDSVNFQSDSLFTGLSSGTYKVILKDANGFLDSISATIKNNCLEVTVLSINESCGNKNGSITTTASGGKQPYLYSIDGINFQSNNIFSSLGNGIYTITAKDSDGLLANIKDTITNISSPLVTTSASTADCDGKNATITVNNTGGTAPFQYSLDSVSFQTNNVFTNINAGNYLVVVKDSNGCVTKDSIHVSKYPVPVVFIGNDTGACAGQTILLKAPAGLQYQWQDGSTGSSYTATNTGLYWVKATNQYNCFTIDSVNIAFKPLPAFSLGNDTSLCEGQVLNIKIYSAPVTASYLWNTGNTTTSLIINTSGLYWLKVSDSGCVSTDSILINYKPLPIVNLGNDTILCEGYTVQLNAGNNDSYLWQDGTATPFYSVSQQGMYHVQVTKNNCVSKDTIHVDYQYKPHFTLGADQFICKGQSLILDPSVADANLLWQDGSTVKSFTVTKPGFYYLSATNECGSMTDSVLITQGVCNLYMPTAFTPNGDSRNDIFKAGFGENITNYHLQIYNRFGQLVFETKDKNAGWDGKFKGVNQPVGAYIWMVQYSSTSNKTTQQLKGTMLLIR
jgi:gliding motility-associated-like protein